MSLFPGNNFFAGIGEKLATEFGDLVSPYKMMMTVYELSILGLLKLSNSLVPYLLVIHLEL